MINGKQRILIVGDTAKSLIDFRGKLVQELSKRHNVYVFVPKIHDEKFVLKLNEWGVGIFESNLNGSNVSILSDMRFIARLAGIIIKIKPTIFFSYTLKPIIYGGILARIFRVKAIVPMITGLGYTFTQENGIGLIKKITKQLLKISLAGKGQCLICQNSDDPQTLKINAIIPASQFVHVVNGSGVDLNHYAATQPNLNSISFLMIARLINAKGVFEYYEAARIVKMLYPRVTFKLAGSSGKNVDSIDETLLAKIKSGEVIEYLGEVADMRIHIRKSAVVMLPSYYGEGVPRCLLEAMAMQRAIITCNSVGCKDTVSLADRPNGFLVPVKNVSALVASMEAYIQQPQLIAQHGQNGRYWAQNKFDVEKVNKDILRIMQL